MENLCKKALFETELTYAIAKVLEITYGDAAGFLEANTLLLNYVYENNFKPLRAANFIIDNEENVCEVLNLKK